MPIPHLKPSQKTWRYKSVSGAGSYSAKNWRYHNPNKKQKHRLVKPLFSFLLICGLVGFVFAAGLFAWYGKDLPDPNKLLDRALAQSTRIYDRTGETVLYEVHGGQRRTLVELEDIPENLKWATIVAEDRKFYEHKGFNFRRIIITLITDVIRGQSAGASTITQQFVKNAILTPEKRVSRKIKELILSYQIEKKFTKDQILKMYFNEIPYGSNAYGAEMASQIYFGKNVAELDLAESATLAAMPQAPTYYYNHPDALVGRRNYILNSMAEFEYTPPEAAEMAKKVELRFVPKKETLIAPHFVMYVKELLTQKYGERLVDSGGLKVYTTIDIDKQELAEQAIAEYASRNEKDYQANNASLVAIDPKTGDILTLVGSRDFYDEEIDGQVNVALKPRQPGSSFKPIVYASAFKNGYTPETLLWDVVTTFKTETGKNYTPHNYDDKERGPVTIRQSLAGSLNIPAVKTIYLTGISNVLDLADSLGYTTFSDRSRFGLSLVLGGGEVKLLEHVAALAVFSQDGLKRPVRSILKVVGPDDEILEEAKDITEERVLDEQVCRQLTSILSDNNARTFIFGAQNYLTLGSRPVAAKTGTTNDYRDAWTIGYTPSLVAGVWVGNNNNVEMKRGADGSVVAAPIWNKFMREALSDAPIENFTPPTPVTTNKPILNGELPLGEPIKIDKVSGKLATDSTPPELIEQKAFKAAHSILHYVAKNNPQGPSPENPANDPYYEPWEQAIKDWLKREKEKADKGDKTAPAIEGLAPTEYDDILTEESKPRISIIAPINNQLIEKNLLLIHVQASSPRKKISRVEYYIDDTFTGASSEPPYSLKLAVGRFENGQHVLKSKVYDDIENSATNEIVFNLKLTDVVPEINWLSPTNNNVFYQSSFPINLIISIPNPSQQRLGIANVKFFYNDRLLGMITNPDVSLNISLEWSSSPDKGAYEIYAETENYQGKKFESNKINVVIK